MRRKASSSGFTLVELLCSVALVGVLSGGLVLLVSRTLEAQIQTQEAFNAEREATRGFAWITRDVESAWLPLSGEPWFHSPPSAGGVFQAFSFSRWGETGREVITYAVLDGKLVRTSVPFGEDVEPRVSEVCSSVAMLEVEPRGQRVAVTLTLMLQKRGQRSFTRVLAPIAEY